VTIFKRLLIKSAKNFNMIKLGVIVIKISYKLTILFVIFVLLIGSMNFFFLYSSLYSQRIDEEIMQLVNRTEGHRIAVEKNFNIRTINQALSIESYTDSLMFFTDQNQIILAASDATEEVVNIIKEEIISINWMSPEWMTIEEKDAKYRITNDYVVVGSPISINSKRLGFVFMLLEIDDIQQTADQIRNQFIWVSTLSVILFTITIFILSKLIVLPLTHMSQATKKLSQGNFNVLLNYNKDDELGELSNSIQILSNNLQRMHKERNEFLASIAHELRTPLTYIKGYADISRRKDISENERTKYLNIIQEEAERLSLLVQNLFELAQIEKHQLLIEKQPCNLRKLSQQTLDALELSFKQNDIQVSFEMEDDIIIDVDPLRFSQVLYNLLDNAKKYTLPHHEVLFKIEDAYEHIRIVIKNQSDGIPEKDLPYIWDRFYRVEKSRSRSSGGSGLGLTIAKEIVEMHGGTIEISQDRQSVSVIIKLKKENC